jgi:hypothetical protein
VHAGCNVPGAYSTGSRVNLRLFSLRDTLLSSSLSFGSPRKNGCFFPRKMLFPTFALTSLRGHSVV